jgi:DNA-binding transcriptional MerR regulator
MFTIGEFATVGRVSVRMLRHYDSIGLLIPARVDDRSGYRYYRADQLRTLNRLLALKDLGFTLDQVRQLLDDAVEVGELRGMLRLRRAELAGRIEADRDRLARVEARLRIIEGETMSHVEISIKPVPSARIAALTGMASSTDNGDVGPVIQGLFERLGRHLGSGALTPAGPAIATYAPVEAGGLRCRAGITVAADAAPDPVEIIDLPGLDAVAALVHRGVMADIGGSYQRLAVWIEENGYRTDGTAREVYLVGHPEPQENWVTEIQMPVALF